MVIAEALGAFFEGLFSGLLTLAQTFGVGWIVLGALGLIALWRVSLVIWPEKKCGLCDGKGARGVLGMLRPCGRCHGSGRETRIGANE